MSGVYENALLNSAARDAADGEEGCFFERETWFLKRCLVASTWSNVLSWLFHLRDSDWWTNLLR